MGLEGLGCNAALSSSVVQLPPSHHGPGRVHRVMLLLVQAAQESVSPSAVVWSSGELSFVGLCDDIVHAGTTGNTAGLISRDFRDLSKHHVLRHRKEVALLCGFVFLVLLG